MGSLTVVIAERREDFRKSERKVADEVLAAPELVLRQSLASLAESAGVSEPTVIRFCRVIGCSGFSDFKIKLAQSLASGAPYIHREVTTDDNLPTIVDKVLRSSVNALDKLRAGLDKAALERAVGALIAARRIDCYGVGAAGIAALDAHQKFMRLGVATSVLMEGHAQTMSAVTLQPGDVALVFSYTGQIRDIVRTARMARERGATVIAVTRSDSVLSKVASMTIAIDSSEDTFVYAPMAIRIAHMACIDILATGVALGRGDDIPALFQQIKDSLADQHIVEGGSPAAERADAPVEEEDVLQPDRRRTAG